MTPENTNTSPILADFMERVGEAWSAADRASSSLHSLSMVGTKNDGRDMIRRFILADWAVRTIAPLALDKEGFTDQADSLRSLTPVVDAKTGRAAESIARSITSDIWGCKPTAGIVGNAAVAVREVIALPRHPEMTHSGVIIDAVIDGPLAGEVSHEDMADLLRRLIRAGEIRPISDRHRWFAWHPVLTTTGRKWLRPVIRQLWERPTGRTDGDGQTWWRSERFWRYADLP